MHTNVCPDQWSMLYLLHHHALGGGASLVDNNSPLMKEASTLALRTGVFRGKKKSPLSHSQPAYPSLFFSEHQKQEAGCSTKLPRKRIFVEQLYWRLFLQKTKPLKQKHFCLNIYYKNAFEISALSIKYSNLISSSRFCSCQVHCYYENSPVTLTLFLLGVWSKGWETL